MPIGGSKREAGDFAKKVGVFTAKVIAINPDREEIINLLKVDEENAEKFKDPEYLGEKDGNTTLRITAYLQDVRTGWITNVSFFIKDEPSVNKAKTAYQFIDSVGNTAWGEEDGTGLPEWFTKSNRSHRICKVGEGELYNFLRNWANQIDYRKADAELILDWKKLMNGNIRELKELMNSEWITDVLCIASINIVEKNGETKDYQQVNNRFFLPGNQIKYFRATKYDDDKIAQLKTTKKLQYHEKLIVKASDPEYGIKEIFTLEELKDYNPNDHFVATAKVIDNQDISY
jgi:hypothetical protein